MARSIDNFHDLKELGIDCDGTTNDPLTDEFNDAATHLQKILANLDNQTLLTLYGYYKQGSEGVCNIPKPSWYDMRAKSKWEAWNKLGDMPQIEAKKLYIDTIKQLDPTFGGDFIPKESWMRVSTMQTNVVISHSEKTIVDFIREGNSLEVVTYLKTNCSNDLFEKLDEEGLGLIHWVADSGYTNILEVLISCGANVNLQDSDGQTALHYAASCGHVECITMLLSNGARSDIVDNDGLDSKSVANDDTVKELLTK